MRSFIFLLAALIHTSANGAGPESSEVPQAFIDAFPASPIACPDGVPDECICGEFENRTALPMRYTRVHHCPHPVLEDVMQVKTYTRMEATAARFTPRYQITDDLMMKSGELHGAAVSWHPNGQIAGIAGFEEGRQVGHARSWHDNGQRAAELYYVDGEPDGKELRYSTSGELEWVIVWNHGTVDRDETRRISKALGIEAPFDRARPPANHDNG